MAPSADLTFPKIDLELLDDLSPPGQLGFLRIVRRKYRATYPDGTLSEPFLYDAVDRNAIDAVVIVAHFVGRSGERRVFLRSALRPPLMLRDGAHSPMPEEACDGRLWELPAGMIEPTEQSPTGVVRGAHRELLEELGFDVALGTLHRLGPSMFPAPGFVAERHFYFEVEVDAGTRCEPESDGSALEQCARVVDLTLEEALALCRTGAIEDAKTELALRRLAEKFA